MDHDLSLRAALWGLAGGFVYAGPKLTAAIYAARKAGRHWLVPAWDFIAAMATSALISSALAPWVMAQKYPFLGKDGPHQLPALACLVGYYFNQMGPTLLTDALKRILPQLDASDRKPAQ